MPRTVEISIHGDHSDGLITELQKFDGLIGLRLQRNASIQPKGDVISMEITDVSLNKLMVLMDKRGLLDNPAVSLTTAHPLSIISKPASAKVSSDVNLATWEEMLNTISKQSNMTIDSMIVMFVSGVLAVIGIVTSALHIVVAAMVIAPGFEPLARISLSVISKSVNWKNGMGDTGKAYGSLFVGAAVTTLFLQVIGKDPVMGEASYLSSGVLMSYWANPTVASILITVVATIAGTLILATHRSILIAGVMIALALVPSVAIFGMGVAVGEADVALNGLGRWIIDAVIVVLLSGLVFFWKKYFFYRRNMKS